MSLTLRNIKGSPLTYTEMDNNLTYLEGLGTTIPSLTDVLSEGNLTDGNNIVMSDGDVINAASGGGQLDLRYFGTDNEVMLSNDGGDYSDEFLYLAEGYIELSSYRANSFVGIYGDRAIALNGINTFINTVSNAINIGGSNTFNDVSNVIALGAFGSNLTASNRVYIANPVIKTESAPANTSDSSGAQGEVRYDSDYIYIKTSAGWKRTALSTF
jgi:hypothetical protein